MNTKLNVLVVSPFVPYPPTDGQRVRTWNLLTRLASVHDVTLVTWVPTDTHPDEVDSVAAAVHELISAPLRIPRLGAFHRSIRHARFVLGAPPPYVQAMQEERKAGLADIERSVLARHRSKPFDLMVLEEEALAWLGLPSLGCPVLLHRLNVFSRAVGDMRSLHPAGRLFHRIEIRSWRRFDRETSRRASQSVALTPESRAELARLVPHVPIGLVTNGVEMRPLNAPPSCGRDVVFVGWMGYPPNIDAATWFVRTVWPMVRSRSPSSRLRLVGRRPSASVLALAADDVVVTGAVPDIVAACEGARAAVAPLRAGMGIKNKTLESMAMGLPVVATSVGAEGIPAAKSDGLIVAGDAAKFAEALIELLERPEGADRLGRAARDFVLRSFDWDVIGARYIALVTEIATANASRESMPTDVKRG